MRDKPFSDRSPRSDPLYGFLGRAIKVERTARGMDRRVLAERSGISYPYLSEIENGSKRPSSQALFALAEALGLGPSALMAAAERLQVEEERRTRAPMRAEIAADLAMPMRAASAAIPEARDERARLIERIQLLVTALDTDDLVRVSDLIDRLRR